MTNSLVPKKSHNEWLEFVSRLGLVNLSSARDIFLSGDYTQITDTGQKALFIAGKAKTLSLEGNNIGSKMTLDEALFFAESRNEEKGFPAKDEILAYIQYESGVFWEKYDQKLQSLNMFRSAMRSVESESLQNTIRYQISKLKLTMGQGSSPQEIRNWIEYFGNKEMFVMQIIALIKLAIHFRKSQQFDVAENLLLEADVICSTHSFQFMREQILSAQGFLKYSLGEHEEAEQLFTQLLDGIENRFIKSITLENLTLIKFDASDYNKASEYIEKAIEHSQKYSILYLLADECLFMGDLQRDQFQQPELATHYYEIGSQAALKMAEHGFRLEGDRKLVVERFENRPRVEYSLPESFAPRIEPFAFATGLSWKQINDIFQFKLIQAHLHTGIPISELPEKLDLKTSTYYAIKRRLAQRGFDLSEKRTDLPVQLRKTHVQALEKYVSNLLGFHWAGANQQFEKEIMEYLFKQVGYQKNRLAKELEVSYPTILQKTKSLSQS